MFPDFFASFPLLLKGMKKAAGVVFGLLLFVSASPIGAAENTPVREMVFSIVRASNPVCEPKCPEWIAAEGDITRNTAKAFHAILKKVGDRRLPLLIVSAGGNVENGRRMGVMIRERKMTVEVARTVYGGCGPRDGTCKPDLESGIYLGSAYTSGAFCNSACVFVLAAGIRRIAGPSSIIGVHQIVHHEERYEKVFKYTDFLDENGKLIKNAKIESSKSVGYEISDNLSAQYKSGVRTYFRYMGIETSILEFMQSTPYTQIHIMTATELERFKLVNEFGEHDAHAELYRCKDPEPPENCILRIND